jgi:hypothetical protein
VRLPRIVVGLLTLTLAVGTLASLSVAAAAVESSGSHGTGSGSSGTAAQNSNAPVCNPHIPAGYARCNSRVRTDANARGRVPMRPSGRQPDLNTPSSGSGYDPRFLESAYNDPAYSWVSQGQYDSSTSVGSGQLVAIVDAYDAANVATDLATYRSYFGLPPCPLVPMPAPAGSKIAAGSSCSFYKVNQGGVEDQYPAQNSAWAGEISLDVDMVSAMCPNCSILLVEANSNSFADLGLSVNEAVNLGASVVSNSYGGFEYSSETTDANAYFNHPGVAVVASTGDNGYGVQFPAAVATVTAVGGTSLTQAVDTGQRGASETETAWSFAGSGCSAYVAKPAWQHDTRCSRRTVADVSAVADPNTGVWVLYNDAWSIFGGTSVASPIIGSMFAVGGLLRGTNDTSIATPEQWPYAAAHGTLFDVTTGSNGGCSGSYLCTAGPGYDGPTGLGTPLGTGAFTGPPAPSAPNDLSATGLNAKVSLAWSAADNATSYIVLRGTSPGAEKQIASGLTATSYTDTRLSNGHTYYYEVEARNSTATSGPSGEVSAIPSGTPGAPKNLHAAPAAAPATGVTLTWTVQSGYPTSYKIWRGTTSGKYSSVWIVSLPPGCSRVANTTCTYTDDDPNNGIISGGTYYYRVSAINGAGTSSQSSQAGPVRAS